MGTRNLVKVFQFVFVNYRKWLIISIIIRILEGIFPLFVLWISKELINAVANLIQENGVNYHTVYWLLLFQLLSIVVMSILRNIQQIYDTQLEVEIDFEIGKKVSKKALNVPYAYFEHPDFLNHLSRIKGSFGNHILSPVKNLLDIGESLISLLSFVSFLSMFHWSLAILSLLSAIPVLIIQKKYGRAKFHLMRYQTPIAREANYINNLLQDRQSAKEIRLFNLGAHLIDKWAKLYRENNDRMLFLLKKQRVANIGLDLSTAVLYSGAASILILLLQRNKLGIGEFVSMGQATQGAQQSINRIASLIAKIYEEQLYIEDLFKFLEFEPPIIRNVNQHNKEHVFPKILKKGIYVENISFRYPNSNKVILNNLNFHIKPGEKIAIVGENGSGKTTLVKCLMGLYLVDKGKIFFDDLSIEMIQKESLHKNITVVFQDFVKYSFTIKDNIVFGDIDQFDNFDRMMKAAKESGVELFVKRFKKGFETRLGRIFSDSEDLSGGQWQKVALARSLFREAQVVVLDEPTASLDPQTELEVFEQFKNLTNGKTVIFISHRMAAARMADRILVMKNGNLVEMGSHNDLMLLRQEYYQMYQMQAKWYA